MESLRLVVLVLFWNGIQGVQWSSTSPPDGQVISACSGDAVTFAWQYLLNTTETPGDAEWYFHGNSEEMIAMTSSHGNFVILPAFGNRVEEVGNAGITLKRVVLGDSGNYSVEVHVYADSGSSHFLLRRSVVLVVTDQLMTTDGSMHVIQSTDPVQNAQTGQFAIQLQCGRFTFTDPLPFHVEWTTPSGETLNSTDFGDERFNLLLPNPILGGTYTCRIPQRFAQQACLHDLAQGQANVSVDRVEARLLLLEKENEQLKQNLGQTTTELATMNSSLAQTLGDGFIRLMKVEEAGQRQVAFQASNLHEREPPRDTPLVFSDVHYNQGDAYNSTSGFFHPPVNGTYVFMATTGSWEADHAASFELCVDQTPISSGYDSPYFGYLSEASAHGVIGVHVGQVVWIRSGGHNYHSSYSTFTGFLLWRDTD